MNRRQVLLAGATALAATAGGAPPLRAQGSAAADGWPARPVMMLVPFVAGGPSDIVARAIATRMQQAIGQPVVVENRPGANGEVAARLLARAAPDGHTLMVGSIGVFAINAALRPNLGYDPVREFTPVTLAVTTPNVLVVNPDRMPATDLAGLIDWLKTQPRRGLVLDQRRRLLRPPHHGAVQAAHRHGSARTCPMPAAPRPATDLIVGQRAALLPEPRHGRCRTSRRAAARRSSSPRAERHPLLPQVPTAAEAGLRDFVVTSWQAMMAPAGMPPPLLRAHPRGGGGGAARTRRRRSGSGRSGSPWSPARPRSTARSSAPRSSAGAR